jgi:predicted lipoprotein
MRVQGSFAKCFSYLLMAGTLAALSLGLSACGDGGSAPGMDAPEDAPDAPARRTLLKNLAERVIVPSYEAAQRDAKALLTATGTLAGTQNDANLKAARDAWTKAMLTWERAEVLQVGPASSVGPDHPGAQNLRDQIYFWPALDACGIDRCLVTKCYEQADFATASLPNVRTLSALEVLLFDERTTTACPADHRVVTAKAWQATMPELAKRRAAYAKAAAQGVVTRTGELVTVWQKGFLTEFVSAGDKSKVFATSREALDALSVSLLYVSSFTKDRKLARPVFCTSDACALETEHPFAKISKESVAANLAALNDVMVGLSPDAPGDAMWGLFDLASSLGAVQFPAKLQVLLSDADGAVGGVASSLEDSVASHSAESMALFQAIEDLSSYLKSDMPSALDVTLPESGVSD